MEGFRVNEFRAARTSNIRELAAAQQNKMQALQHLRNAGEEWSNVKADLGERGINIADWCKGYVRQQTAARSKHWSKSLDARRWAAEVSYVPSRPIGLECRSLIDRRKRSFRYESEESRRAADAGTNQTRVLQVTF